MPASVWYAQLGKCELCKRWKAIYRAVIEPHDDEDYDLWCWPCLVHMGDTFLLHPPGQRNGPVRQGEAGPVRGTE